MKLRTLAGSLLFVAPAASAAQSLINGQAVQYNYAYRCKGERVIVAHCRDEQDSSYCQIVYPDRPYVNGNQVAPVEMRGDIVAKLNACSQTASAPAARSSSPATAGNAPRKAASAKTGTPPGVGKASWHLMDYDETNATYYNRARLKRTGNAAEGWFTTVYAKPKDLPDAGLSDIQFFQARYGGNCSKGTMQLREGAYFDENGKLLTDRVVDGQPDTAPRAGSIGEEQLNVLCGKAAGAAKDPPINGNGDFIVFYYLSLLHQGEGQKQ